MGKNLFYYGTLGTYLVSTPKRFEIRFKVTLSTPHNLGSAYPMNPFSVGSVGSGRISRLKIAQKWPKSEKNGEHAQTDRDTI